MIIVFSITFFASTLGVAAVPQNVQVVQGFLTHLAGMSANLLLDMIQGKNNSRQTQGYMDAVIVKNSKQIDIYGNLDGRGFQLFLVSGACCG